MFCSNCGKELPDTARFCSRCGRKFETIEHGKQEAGGIFQKKIILLLLGCLVLLVPLFYFGLSFYLKRESGKIEEVESAQVREEPGDGEAPLETEGSLQEEPWAEQTEEPAPETLRYVDAQGEWHEALIDPTVKKHEYDWACLNKDGQTVSYEGDDRHTVRRGIDVSYYQGAIDWEKVKAAGYDFAFLRIAYRGYTSGELKQDSEFANYIRPAQEAGLDVGVYVFSQAVNEAEALEEADFVLDALQGYEISLPVVYNPARVKESGSRTAAVTGAQFTANTLAFCKKIQEAGYQPMVYSNLLWDTEIFDRKQIDGYPVWYADYGALPQTPYDFTFWQYTSKGQVDGISGAVALNVQFMEK